MGKKGTLIGLSHENEGPRALFFTGTSQPATRGGMGFNLKREKRGRRHRDGEKRSRSGPSVYKRGKGKELSFQSRDQAESTFVLNWFRFRGGSA